MKIQEFIKQFAETHSVQHINDITAGTVEKGISKEIYLVNNIEVTE